jgi:aspartate oxidase
MFLKQFIELYQYLRDMTNEPIVIIGGRISGLIAAIHLEKIIIMLSLSKKTISSIRFVRIYF